MHGAPSSAELLADTIHEVDAPINNRGPVHVTPFVQARATYFEQVLDRSGDEWRGYGRIGARAATQNWHVYEDVDNSFWDIHKIRHINTFDVTAYAADTNVPFEEAHPLRRDRGRHAVGPGRRPDGRRRASAGTSGSRRSAASGTIARPSTG